MPLVVNRAALTAARQRLDGGARALQCAVAAELVQATPVLTGQLRAAWTVTMGGAAADGTMAPPDPAGAATVARLQEQIAAAPTGAKVSFRQLAPYAGYVEFGTSRMAPRAFIRGTIARIPAIAAELAAGMPR